MFDSIPFVISLIGTVTAIIMFIFYFCYDSRNLDFLIPYICISFFLFPFIGFLFVCPTVQHEKIEKIVNPESVVFDENYAYVVFNDHNNKEIILKISDAKEVKNIKENTPLVKVKTIMAKNVYGDIRYSYNSVFIEKTEKTEKTNKEN